MKNTTTLLVIDIDTPDALIAEVAEGAAKDQSHLSCLLIGPAPVLPVYAYGMSPYGGMNIPDNWGEWVSNARQEHKDRVDQIENVLARSGVSGEVQSVLCATADVKQLVALRARVSDMAFVAPNLREQPDILREAGYGVLFESPAGLMLNAPPSLEPETIFVAWDSSKPASRAVHTALPYLKAAKEVVVGCFDPVMSADKDGADPGTAVSAWLSHHGCNVTLTQYPTGGREIGRCIQDRANEAGAHLVVMGAYGHARMIEAVFGGTTRTMIEQTDLPVLLAH